MERLSKRLTGMDERVPQARDAPPCGKADHGSPERGSARHNRLGPLAEVSVVEALRRSRSQHLVCDQHELAIARLHTPSHMQARDACAKPGGLPTAA